MRDEPVSTEQSPEDVEEENEESPIKRDIGTQTDMKFEEQVAIQKKVVILERKLEFQLSNIKDDKGVVTFYTGFPPMWLMLKSGNESNCRKPIVRGDHPFSGYFSSTPRIATGNFGFQSCSIHILYNKLQA